MQVTQAPLPIFGPEGCKNSAFHRQFGQPTGWLGWLVGHLMAAKSAPMNRLAVELLEVKPEDRILEIGFGPGTAVALLAERAQRGFVAGVDRSEVMVRQTTKRNRKTIQMGRVEVRQGSASSLPFGDNSFDKVLAVNSFHHWTAPEHDLLEVRRVMRDGGTLVLALRMALPNPKMVAAPGLTAEQVGQAKSFVEQAGFRDVRTIVRDVGRQVTCLLANK